MSEIYEVLHTITGVTKRVQCNFESVVWCLWTFLSGLCLITAFLTGRWVCAILLFHPTLPETLWYWGGEGGREAEQRGEADGLRGRKCLRRRWREVAGNRDFSYHLITAGSRLGDWIKEVHLVFICWTRNLHFAETVAFTFSATAVYVLLF